MDRNNFRILFISVLVTYLEVSTANTTSPLAEHSNEEEEFCRGIQFTNLVNCWTDYVCFNQLDISIEWNLPITKASPHIVHYGKSCRENTIYLDIKSSLEKLRSGSQVSRNWIRVALKSRRGASRQMCLIYY